MKKIIYFIIPIIFVLFFGSIITILDYNLSPITFWWFVSLLTGSILLSFNLFWGGILGMIPGAHLVYMGMQETGQPMDIELSFGITILIFYILCSVFVFHKRNKRRT